MTPLTDDQKGRIKYLRYSCKWTLTSIANELGCGVQTVSRILDPELDARCRQSHKNSEAANPLLRPLSAAKCRANRQGVPFDLTYDTCPEITDNCTKCGVRYKGGEGKLAMTSRTLDKIIPEKGYVPNNVMWLCFRCNKQKSNLTLEDFRGWVEFLEDIQ